MPKSKQPREWTFLRRAMFRARLTPTSLAERADLSLPYVCQLLKGTRGPSARVLYRLADALDADPAELDRTKPTVPPRANPKPAPRRPGVTEAAHKEVA